MTPSPKRNRNIAIALGVAGLVSVVVGTVVGILFSEHPPLIAGVALGVVMIVASCGFAVAAASPPAATTATVLGRAVIVGLAWLAPTAVFIALMIIPFVALTLLSLAGGTYPGCAFV
jgi:hypothetical protein